MVNSFLSTNEQIKLSRLLLQAEELYSSVGNIVFADNRAKNLLKSNCINFLAKANLSKNNFDEMSGVASPVPRGWARTLVLNSKIYFDFQKTNSLSKLPPRSSYRNIRSISNEGLRDNQLTISSLFEERESSLSEDTEQLRYGIFLYVWRGSSISEAAIVFPNTEFSKITSFVNITKINVLEPNAEEAKEFERTKGEFKKHLKEERKLN